MTADLLFKAKRQVEKVLEHIKGTLFEKEFKEDIEIALNKLHFLYNISIVISLCLELRVLINFLVLKL